MLILFYLVIILYITLISRNTSVSHPINADLFSSYVAWVEGGAGHGIQILLNIFLFVPLGFFLADFFNGQEKKLKNVEGSYLRIWLHPLLISFAVSVVIEATQYVCALGYCDIDDIVSNVLGAFLGVLVYHIFLRLIVVEKQRKWNGRLSVLLIAGGLIGCIMSSASLRVYVPVSQAETAIHMVYLKAVGVLAEHRVKNTDLLSIVEYGTLKVYEPKYEVYIYQYDGKLYWLIGTPIDKKTEIIFHLHTNEPDKLPEHRKKYKFDNRGFRVGGNNELTTTMRCGKYRVFERVLPSEYNITAVTVGFNTDGKITWTGSFRVEK